MTELDFTILAIVSRDGPLSAYDVRKVFAASLTATWSSSTGSIYPSIRRLESSGYIKTSKPEGARSRRKLSLTPAGRSVLRPWLTEISPEAAGPTADPVRTKMFFLMLLDPDERAAVVGLAIQRTAKALSDAELFRTRGGQASEFERLATEGAVFQLRGRLDWLRWAQKRLSAADGIPG